MFVKNSIEKSEFIIYNVLDQKYKWITDEINKLYDCLIYHMMNTFKSNFNKIMVHVGKNNALLGFVILSVNQTSSELEILKLYGNKEKLVKQCIEKFNKCKKVHVYTSTPVVSQMLRKLGFNSFTISTHSNIGIKLFKPKIRHTRVTESQQVGVEDIITAYKMLKTYMNYPLFTIEFTMKKNAVFNVYKEQDEIKDHNEIGGKFEIVGNDLFLPKRSLYKGNGLSVKVCPSPVVYHVHPTDFVTVDNINKILLAWPSGMDYVSAIYNRFIQQSELCALNFVTSKKGIFSYQMSPMFIFFMNFIVNKNDRILIAKIICTTVKYYFKLVEDIRSIHMHIYSSYTKHILTDMTTSIMNTKKMLVDSFNLEKVISILNTSNDNIKKMLKNTFYLYCFGTNKNAIKKNYHLFDQTFYKLKQLSSGFNFPIIELGNVMWENINLGKDEITVMLYANEHESRHLKQKYNTTGVFFKKIFNLENNVI